MSSRGATSEPAQSKTEHPLQAKWATRPLKALAKCLDGARIPIAAELRVPGPFPYFGANGVVDTVDGYLFDEELVLLGEDGAPFFDPNSDVARWVTGKIWVNNHAHVLRPTGINGRFLAYALNAVDYSAYITGSTRDKLTQQEMRSIVIPLPPAQAQQRVVDYLDHVTARIDTLIDAEKRVIDLVTERSKSIVTALVTTGHARAVGPDGRTDAEWLGNTPANWSVMPLKRFAACDNSGSWGDEPGSREFDLPVATTAQIAPDGAFRVSDMPMRSFDRADVARYTSQPGDILVVKSSGSATSIISGKAGRITPETPTFVFSNFLMRLRVDPEIAMPGFVYAFLTSHVTIERIKRMVSATTYPNLRVDEYMASTIPLPPLDEQARIVDELSTSLSSHSTLMNALVRSIALLQERRASLITAAVTGQIDANREAA